MGGGTTSVTTIPDELKPLFTNTAQKISSLQNYYWGNLNSNYGYYLGGGPRPSPVTSTGSGGGNNIIGGTELWNQGTGHGNAGGLQIIDLGGTKVSQPAGPQSAASGNGQGGIQNSPPGGAALGAIAPWDPEIGGYRFGTRTPGTTTPPVGREDYSGLFNLAGILGVNPLEVPGLSGYQQAVGQYIPKLLDNPLGEVSAMNLSAQAIRDAGMIPDDIGDWSLAGRTGFGERLRNDLNQTWDPTLSPLWNLVGEIPSVYSEPSGGGSGGGQSGVRTKIGTTGSGPPTVESAENITDSGSDYDKVTSLGASKAASGLNDRIMKALDLFEKTKGEATRNEMTAMGLGSSQHLANALEMGRAELVAPLIAEDLRLQENAINRRAGLLSEMARQRENAIIRQAQQAEQSLGRQERGIERLIGTKGAAADIGLKIAGNETNRLLEALNLGMKQGELERQIGREQAASLKDEFVRHQALAEQSLFGPLGGFMPSAFGTRTSK